MIKRFINILQGGEARAYPSLSPERQIVQRWWNCRQKQGANRGAKPWEVLSAGNALQNRAISPPKWAIKPFFFLLSLLGLQAVRWEDAQPFPTSP